VLDNNINAIGLRWFFDRLSVKFEQVLICNIKENLFNSIFGFGFFKKKKNNLETEKKITNNQTR
jgi:hypothetical protein